MHLKKYLYIYKSNLETAIEYRANLVGNIIRDMISLAATLLLWLAIFSQNSSVAGYTKEKIILYYAFAPIIGLLTLSMASDTLSKEIKMGDLSNQLMKPQRIWLLSLGRNLAQKTFYVGSMLVAYLISLFFFLDYFVGAGFTIQKLLLGLFVGLIGFILHFTIDLAVAWSAFWVHEVWAFKHAKYIMLMLLGGQSFPFELLPEKIERIFNLLPFKFLYFTPISYIVGTRTSDYLLQDLALFLFWFLVFMLLSKLLWIRGLKKYEAFGK